MHGSGSTPPVRSEGVVITLRVLFTACAVISCGMLSCVPLFRVAILRGRPVDWVAAWLSLPAAIAAFAVVGEMPERHVSTDIAMSCVLLLGAASAVYFLVFDIRHQARLAATGPGAALPRVPYGPYTPHVPHVPQHSGAARTPQPPYVPQAAPPQYGYPNPYASTPVVNPAPAPVPASAPVPAPSPAPVPQPQQTPHRMDQVRAELDELSDLLRNKDQRGDQPR
ncbi:hypothetical protein [Streptomyces sp. Wb2n-11]|uniref:hypothetical protein n=1 Tax=Streptomyces sp. Wb2n-11 TaxID=1030533 RepID=UPI000A4C5800|nr:hypothetical protein [Streptomyces sp. Wb2n-11]